MTELQIKEKINNYNYLDKLPTSKLEEIASYVEKIYQAESAQYKSGKQSSEYSNILNFVSL
ncbi:hypothetical protein [Geminocystis sp. GBBB08]|uniref:hypothetical protein n=1 Tax=Geminocystis sp. GBBB08 TaxID=2604140 RepID=UPI0027E34EBA|nr:hypothetical protein [Geminocystis sp. GBBB08]MBL1210049.1 hypothetical protein [Geminocystis sp. GBBB08]